MNNSRKSKDKLIKDLNAAQREIAIQKALDRIRRRALTMKTTEDIGPVVAETRAALIGLGITPYRTHIDVVDKKRDLLMCWGCKRKAQFSHSRASLSEYLKGGAEIHGPRPQGKRWQMMRYNRRQLAAQLKKGTAGFDAFVDRSVIDAWIAQEPQTAPIPFYQYLFYYSGGQIGLGMDRELDKDEVAVARRVTETFNFAYKRFAELEAKEERTREAEVEAALERVRARALGMQESRELSEVSYLLSNELGKLVQGYIASSLITIDEEARILYDHQQLPGWAPGDVLPVIRFEIDEIDPDVPIAHVKEAYEARDRGDATYERAFSRQETVAILRWINHYYAAHYPDQDLTLPETAPDDASYICVMSASGYLEVARIAFGRYGDDEIALIKRFADVFDFAYSRFCELKEKEDQNRELTIQNAIERVRSRALEMQESQEIGEVALGLFNEFTELGFPIHSNFIYVSDVENDRQHVWFSHGGGSRSFVSPLSEMLEQCGPFFREWYTRMQESREVQVRDLDRETFGKELRPELKARGWGGDIERYIRNLPDRIVTHYVPFSDSGALDIRTSEPLDKEGLAVCRRFAEAFGFAYSRFVELKQKEDQNRELTIQNAIERVRAQAQGMQVSDEIAGVARAIYVEVQGLDFDLIWTGVYLADYEKGNTTSGWLFSERIQGLLDLTDEELNKRKPVAHQILPELLEQIREARARGDRHIVRQLEGQALREARRQGGSDYGLTGDELETFIAQEPSAETLYHIFYAHGTIVFNTAESLSEEDLLVAKRFTDVFDYAYDRFQELKEKEDQNRELTIQNALEKVRAQALSMQVSEDIFSVTTVLHEQMAAVGIQSIVTSIEVVDRENGMFRSAAMLESVEMTDWEEVTMASFQTIRAHNRMLEAFDRGDDVWVTRLEGEECREHQQFWIEKLFESNPEARDLGYPDQSSVTFALVFFSRGWIFLELGSTVGDRGEPGFQLIEGDPLSEEELMVVKRFADMFEFAYSRFLELKEKEDQNRELTIQNALERVRAQALGMQMSDELSEVATVLLNQVRGLGWDAHAAVVVVFDKATGDMEFWGTREDGLGYGHLEASPPGSFQAEINDQMSAAREAGASWFVIERNRDERSRWWREIYEATGLPDEEILERLRGISEHEVTHRVFYERGFLGFNLEERLSDDDLAVAKRFADAFGFAYSRFLELKGKEEQVRAADQRAAVDRVRAEAAAMEGTEDIANVVKALWEGLQGQNVDYDFLSMEVIDEDANLLQAYAAIPDDSPILSLLAMEAQQGTRRERAEEKLLEGINLLRSEISLSDAIESGFSKADLSRTVLTDGGRDDRGEFLEKVWGLSPSADRRPSVKAVRAGFNHGSINLYTGIDVEIVDETVALVEALGDAVSLGFARYWDFRELEEQNRALEEANEEVREATRLKSQFLATMSHELRTPMNAIIGFTQLVLRRAQNLEDRQRGNLEKVRLSADHLLALINDILDLSKVEAGRVDVAPSTFNVPPLLEHCCATVGPTLGKAGVELVCEIEDAVDEAYTDESRLRQIVTNLLSNALKFTDTGEVRVVARILDSVDPAREAEVSGSGPYVEVAVSDTGIGIPENQREAVFEEFRQVDGSNTRRHQGTGLGLKITKQLIELLGGTIWLESELGKGSTFTFQIPVRYNNRAAVQESRGAEDMPGSGAEQQVTGDVRTIVSIDDDPNVAILLRQELETEGYTVISALTADEGVALVKKHQPAAVTVDILMPGKDGWQTIGLLKGDPDTRDIPIIVLSAIENKSLGLAMGVKDYLIKPVDRDALMAVLGRVDNGSVKDVLVVDDEPSAADLLSQILSEEGLSSRQAANGREALDRIAERVPDAILLDLMMPEMDGFEVVAKLQEDPIWRTIPVIVVTAKDLESDERTYLAKHAEKVVQKGRLDPAKLAQAIREAIAQDTRS